ncbi:MAG: alpha-E domain-containing protein [Gammaproteobacteria bacterium]|nr:alpha-E domain-containing protein [Gammaproteobacteria bacterium]
MLGKTAGGLYWMFRYLERSENTTRLLEAGMRIAVTRSSAAVNEWSSIVTTAGARDAYLARHDDFEAGKVIDFLLRDRANPSSVLSVVEAARNNARLVRTALTREVWEATNECWMTLKATLARPVSAKNLTEVLATIRQQSGLVRGALHGTMLRNDIYNFTRLGTFIERADSTARILDVKYYVLLPSVSHVGSSLDNVQWETILRSVSGMRAYRWKHGGEVTPNGIAEFLILDPQMPRSLAFCFGKVVENLGYLAMNYEERHACHALGDKMQKRLGKTTITSIFDYGLHEFIVDFLRDTNALGRQIEQDYRFTE